jgi:hypothetical protein
MVKGPDGAWNQESLWWRRPAANYCSAHNRKAENWTEVGESQSRSMHRERLKHTCQGFVQCQLQLWMHEWAVQSQPLRARMCWNVEVRHTDTQKCHTTVEKYLSAK